LDETRGQAFIPEHLGISDNLAFAGGDAQRQIDRMDLDFGPIPDYVAAF